MYKEKVHRGLNILADEGFVPFLRSSSGFASRVLDLKLLLKSAIGQTLRTHDREGLFEYCRNKRGCSVFTYSTSEEYTIDTTGIGIEPPVKFRQIAGQHTFEQPFLAELASGKICSNGIVTTEDGTIVLESAGARRDKIDRKNTLFQLIRHNYDQNLNKGGSNGEIYVPEAVCPLFTGPVQTEEKRRISDGIEVRDESNSGHANMLLRELPRLEGVMRYIECHDEKVLLLIGPEPRPMYVQSLSMLGFDEDLIKQWGGRSLTAKKVLVPSVRRYENKVSGYFHNIRSHATYKVPSPMGLEWLQRNMQNGTNVDVTFPDRIYISRADASTRRVLNREELMKMLSSYGFSKVVLSNMPLEHQIKLFSEANIIVGPHGAGLANVVFSRDASIIELLGPKRKPTFFATAVAMGLDYDAVTCPTENKDIIVNLPELEKKIQDVLSQNNSVEF